MVSYPVDIIAEVLWQIRTTHKSSLHPNFIILLSENFQYLPPDSEEFLEGMY
jgi:hypothetical protein